MRPGGLWKEWRVLAPYLLAAPVVALMAYWSRQGALILLGLTITMAAVKSFGQEHTHQCLGWLIAQPIARRRLWLNKLMVLLVFTIGLLLSILILGIGAEWIRWHMQDVSEELLVETPCAVRFPLLGKPAPPAFIKPGDYQVGMQSLLGSWQGSIFTYGSIWISLLSGYTIKMIYPIPSGASRFIAKEQAITLLPYLLWAVGLVSGGFWMGLALRQSHTAFWAALVIPMLLSIIWQILSPLFFTGSFDPQQIGLTTIENHGGKLALLYWQWGLPFLTWGFIALLASWIHIKRLEA